MTERRDVIIIGAGFAGLTAARELSRRGLSVLVLEARDRVGGRTWTDHRLGVDVEVGGSWIHPLQPHVWTELARYGLQTFPSPDPDRVLIADSRGPRELTVEEGLALYAHGTTELLKDGGDVFPLPFEPLSARERLAQVEDVTMASRLAKLDLDEDCRTVTEAFWATSFHGPLDQSALSQGLRWWALSRCDAATLLEQVATYKIVGGTRALADALAADSAAEVQLEQTVASVARGGGDALVETVTGERYAAPAVIVTLPINALSGITFDPPLSEGKRAVASQGQVSCGIKLWIRVRGSLKPFIALAPPSVSAITYAQFEYPVEGDSVLVAFGPDGTQLSATDRQGAEAALRHWLPDAEVVDVAGHDWVQDPLTRQTWAMLRPGQLIGSLEELQRPEEGVYLAGGDYASGWLGFIDGAIERGLVVARQILDDVSSGRPAYEAEGSPPAVQV